MSIGIRATAFKLPEKKIAIKALRAKYAEQTQHLNDHILQIPKLKTITLEEVASVRSFSAEPVGQLALEAIQQVLAESELDGDDLGLLIDFSTVSRDENGISLCYKIQRELGAAHALTLAIGNGSCTSFQLAIKTAMAFMHSETHIQHALLFSEDRMHGKRYNAPFNVLGDGASAVLLSKNAPSNRILTTQYRSFGKFSNILGTNHWQPDNFDFGQFEDKIVPFHYKVIHQLTKLALVKTQLNWNQIDLVLYQNMSENDYLGLIGGLGFLSAKVFRGGLRGHGHIFGSDLVINFNLAMKNHTGRPGQNWLLISSGAGFSWSVTIIAFGVANHLMTQPSQANGDSNEQPLVNPNITHPGNAVPLPPEVANQPEVTHG